MSRLIAFGDSQTYGHGLPDCWDYEKKTLLKEPSKLSWPNYLVKHLGLDEVVLTNYTASPGASNLEILYKILCFDYKPGDVVTIYWSFTARDIIFNEQYYGKVGAWDTNKMREQIKIGNWIDTDLVKNWYAVHSKEDYVLRSWFYIHHAECFLNTKSIENYSILTEPPPLQKIFPGYLNFKNVDFHHDYRKIYVDNEKALDGLHGGIKCNEETAKTFHDFIIGQRFARAQNENK